MHFCQIFRRISWIDSGAKLRRQEYSVKFISEAKTVYRFGIYAKNAIRNMFYMKKYLHFLNLATILLETVFWSVKHRFFNFYVLSSKWCQNCISQPIFLKPPGSHRLHFVDIFRVVKHEKIIFYCKATPLQTFCGLKPIFKMGLRERPQLFYLWTDPKVDYISLYRRLVAFQWYMNRANRPLF